jgi:uncharacterized Zn-binding protein involved in type VI secretion
MAGPFIRLGDRTSHGGTVVEASAMSDIDGIGIARIGDKVTCPVHGDQTIVGGDMTLVVDGKPVARHGDEIGCGARLIAGQQASVDQV